LKKTSIFSKIKIEADKTSNKTAVLR